MAGAVAAADALARPAACPAAGFRLCRPMLLGGLDAGHQELPSPVLLDLDQVARPCGSCRASCGVSSTLDRLADPAEPRASAACRAGAGSEPLRRLDLLDLQRQPSDARLVGARRALRLGAAASASAPPRRRAGAAARRRSCVAGLLAAAWRPCGCRAPALIDRPRSSATSSGVRRPRRPSIVALTRLIGFWVPMLLVSTSRMPPSSSTARTPPPAITPVPGWPGAARRGRRRSGR